MPKSVTGATNSIITHNTVESNVGYGIRANGADVIGNTWIENSVFGNSIGGIANTSLVWCDVEATIAEVAGRMMESYVRHVLVEDDGRLVGVVS